MSKFFEKFDFMENFLLNAGETQDELEQQISQLFTKEDAKLASFLGDKEGVSTLLIWIGKEYVILKKHDKWKKKEKICKNIWKIINKNEHTSSLAIEALERSSYQ